MIRATELRGSNFGIVSADYHAESAFTTLGRPECHPEFGFPFGQDRCFPAPFDLFTARHGRSASEPYGSVGATLKRVFPRKLQDARIAAHPGSCRRSLNGDY